MMDESSVALTVAHCYRSLSQPVQDVEDLLYTGDVPLLCAHVGVANQPLLVNDEESRPLAQRPNARGDPIPPVNGPSRVHKNRKGPPGQVEVLATQGGHARRDHDHHRIARLNFRVVLAQLRQVCAGKRSTKPAQEDQHHVLVFAKIRETDRLSLQCREHKVRGRRPHVYPLPFPSHPTPPLPVICPSQQVDVHHRNNRGEEKPVDGIP